jgi:rhodanese-related sulfurtransferase
MNSRVFREALVLILLSLAGAAGTHYLHPRAPAWYLSEAPLEDDEVSMASITERWEGDVFWIDARVSEQFEAEHVPGAISLNEQNFVQTLFDHLERLQDNAKPIILYCGSEKCQASKKIKQALLERLPLENVFILKGGWQAWKQSQK